MQVWLPVQAQGHAACIQQTTQAQVPSQRQEYRQIGNMFDGPGSTQMARVDVLHIGPCYSKCSGLDSMLCWLDADAGWQASLWFMPLQPGGQSDAVRLRLAGALPVACACTET